MGSVDIINHGRTAPVLPYYKQQKAAWAQLSLHGNEAKCVQSQAHCMQAFNLHGSGLTSESVSILLGGTGPAPNIYMCQQTH